MNKNTILGPRECQYSNTTNFNLNLNISQNSDNDGVGVSKLYSVPNLPWPQNS
jgi:hypothetical protein